MEPNKVITLTLEQKVKNLREQFLKIHQKKLLQDRINNVLPVIKNLVQNINDDLNENTMKHLSQKQQRAALEYQNLVGQALTEYIKVTSSENCDEEQARKALVTFNNIINEGLTHYYLAITEAEHKQNPYKLICDKIELFNKNSEIIIAKEPIKNELRETLPLSYQIILQNFEKKAAFDILLSDAQNKVNNIINTIETDLKDEPKLQEFISNLKNAQNRYALAEKKDTQSLKSALRNFISDIEDAVKTENVIANDKPTSSKFRRLIDALKQWVSSIHLSFKKQPKDLSQDQLKKSKDFVQSAKSDMDDLKVMAADDDTNVSSLTNSLKK